MKLVLICLFLPLAYAIPEVSVIDGTLAHGQQITVSGSGFGIKSPAAPLWWDDMEGATGGEVVNDYTDMPWVVSGSLTQKRYSEAKPFRGLEPEPYMRFRDAGYRSVEAPHQYSTEYAAGAHYQFENNDPQYSNDYYQNVVLTVDSGTADKNQWYVRWYYRIDPEWEIVNDYANHKLTAPNFGTTIYDQPNCYSSHGQQATPGKTDEHNVILSVGNCVGGCGAELIENPSPNPRLKWVAHEQLWDSPAGFHQIWKYAGPGTNSGLATEITGDTSGCTNAKDNTRSFSIGGWFATNTNLVEEDKRGGQNNYRYFDDVYADNTFSRVVLADSPDYESATIVEPQIPSAWSDGSITASVNLGALGDEAYLFVFDSNNEHNAVGFPVASSRHCSSADADTSGDVTLYELMDFVDSWMSGSVYLGELMLGISDWKNGC